MRSTFYGLEIARKGLFVSQKALDVTGHNVANANTPGYTRQRLDTAAIVPGTSMGMFTYTSKGQVGGGVEIQRLTQIRDSFLDMQYRKESKALGEWSAKSSAMAYIEDIFSEPSDASINTIMGEFFSKLQELTKNPESKEIRTLVRENAIKLTDTLHHYYSQLQQLQREQNTGITIGVDEVNAIATQIADLNSQIFRFEVGGEQANDLRDQRNLLLDKLSGMMNVQIYEVQDPGLNGSRLRIDIHGMPLVDHTQVNLLEAAIRSDKANPNDVEGLVDIRWKGSNILVPITGGTLKGYIDMRDGVGANNNGKNETIGIPYYLQKLDEFAAKLVEEVNKVHQEAYTLPYEDKESVNGVNFFDPTKISAKDIEISAALKDSVFNIATSSVKVEASNSDDPVKKGNNLGAMNLANLRNIEFTGFGRFESFIGSVISGLAVDAAHSTSMKNSQQVLVDHLNNQRMQVSSVSLDEEMTNMIMFQQAYAAAARTITAMDEALDILINRTGLVGR